MVVVWSDGGVGSSSESVDRASGLSDPGPISKEPTHWGIGISVGAVTHF